VGGLPVDGRGAFSDVVIGGGKRKISIIKGEKQDN